MDFKRFIKIHANASSFQLGAVIIHKGKPIDFCSRKLSGVQQQYTVMERELISIVETLKDYKKYYLVRNYKSILIIKTLRVKKLIPIEYSYGD